MSSVILNKKIEMLLAEIKSQLGLKGDGKVAELMGVSSQTFSNRKVRGTLYQSLLALAKEKNINIQNVILNGESAENAKGDLSADSTIFIPLFSVEASAGGGSLVEDEEVIDTIAFKEEWIRRDLGVNPKDLALISTIGDSMEPTLRAGDMVLLDKSVEKIKDEAIYAMSVDGMLLIKRVRWRPDGGLTLLSDNSEYENVTIEPDMKAALRVVGRLMWTGRRL